MQPFVIILIVVVVLVAFMLFLMIATRYKKCPPDKIMVIYGKVGADKEGNPRSAKCIHGGAALIWPLVQSFTYLDLTPLSISVDLKSALSRQNIRIDVPSIFTVGISTEPTVMENAAERLRGLKLSEIQDVAKDIIFGQFFIAYAPIESENFQSLPKNLAEKYKEKFKYPERIAKVNGEIVAVPFKPVRADKER